VVQEERGVLEEIAMKYLMVVLILYGEIIYYVW
jgi:hypothetical protein